MCQAISIALSVLSAASRRSNQVSNLEGRAVEYQYETGQGEKGAKQDDVSTEPELCHRHDADKWRLLHLESIALGPFNVTNLAPRLKHRSPLESASVQILSTFVRLMGRYAQAFE